MKKFGLYKGSGKFFKLMIFLVCLGCNTQNQNIDTAKPNIILIYMDDLGWKDLGHSGSTFYETPNIDRLAASGMKFTRAYSAAPLCAPSRGAVVTGRSPARNKYTNVLFHDNHATQDHSLHEQSKEYGIGNQNLEALHRHALGKENTLFAEKLVAAGYETAYLGKWHNGWFDGYRPEDRGYNYVAGTAYEAFYDHVITGESLKHVYNLPEAKEGDYLAELLTNNALSFIESIGINRLCFTFHIILFMVRLPQNVIYIQSTKTKLGRTNAMSLMQLW